MDYVVDAYYCNAVRYFIEYDIELFIELYDYFYNLLLFTKQKCIVFIMI